MATTYLDYVIKYGGVVKSTNTNTGLTSIVIKYGTDTKATITTNTTKTLPMSGKYCNKNITIGAKTLPTSGKYANQNVTVETSKRYRWNKYNCVTSYSAGTYDPPYKDATQLFENMITVPNTYIAVFKNPTKSFNTSTGMYTLTGEVKRSVAYAASSDRRDEYDNGNHYYLIPSASSIYGSNKTVSASQCADNMMKEQYVRTHIGLNRATYEGSAYGTYARNNPSSSEYWLCQRYYAITNYSKGSTSHGQVNSTNASAYPTNGRHSDGYWYVAV